MNAKRFLLVPLVIAVFLGATAAGQVIRGSISGTVVDPQGAVVQGATVTATNTQTAAVFTAKSDSSGLFRLQQLPVGPYNVQISMTGFQNLARNGIQVVPGADKGLGNMQLALGQVSQTVEVAATNPLVDTSEAQVTNNFSTDVLQMFAGVAENQGLDQLALYIPGVNNPRDLAFSNSNGVDLSVNGLRGRSNDQQLDGQNNNDNSVGGPGIFLSDPEFVQEYQVTTNNFGAQYGRNAGSVVNIITKSGTNTWHGSAFGNESNSALNTRNNIQKRFDQVSKVPQFNEEFSGGTIGGPIVKNRLFFFGGFDNDLVGSQSVFSTGNVTPDPTGLATLATCFPGNQNLALLQKAGPFAITGGNPTPQAPRPVAVTGCGPVEMSGVQRTLANDVRTWDWMARVDLQYTHDRVSGRYLYNKQTFVDSDQFSPSLAAAGFPVSVPSLGQAATLSWSRDITNRMVNELRLNYSRNNVVFGGNSLGTVPDTGGIANALSQISFSAPKLLSLGVPNTAPQGRVVNNYQIQDNWNYVRGKHQLKAGVNFTYQKSPNTFLPNFNGSFVFPDWSAFFANTPSATSITLGTPFLDFREKDTFLYFGDDFKVTPSLTVNLGLTWSYYGQPANLFNDLTVKRESNASTAFFNPAVPLDIRTFPRIPAPKNSWGPSLGFAWSPQFGGFLTGNGKLVIRGGYRLAYDPPFYNIYLNIATSAPQVLAQTVRGIGVAPPLPANPTGTAVRAALSPLLTLGVFDPRTFNQTTVSPDFGPDRVHTWSFGVQRQFGNSIAAEVRYAGNHAQHLFQSINANPDISGLAASFPSFVPSNLTPCPAASAVVPKAVGRINCNEGILRERTNTGFSDYNALQSEVRVNNLWKQLTLRTSYTFSKTTDTASEIFGSFAGGGTTAFSQNPLDIRHAEHGLSGLDIPHNWSIGFQEQLPFMRNQTGWLGRVVGGWIVSGSYILSSGQTYTPTQFAINGSGLNDQAFMDAFNSSVENLRPYLGNPAAPANQVGIFGGDLCTFAGIDPTACPVAANSLISFNQFNANGSFNPVNQNQVRFIANGSTANALFGTPFGNVGRNSLRDAKTNFGNFSLYKVFKITERTNLQWHMTMQNVFNHPNYQSIDPFVDDAGLTDNETGFADPTLFTDSTLGTTRHGRRQIVFGLRFGF